MDSDSEQTFDESEMIEDHYGDHTESHSKSAKMDIRHHGSDSRPLLQSKLAEMRQLHAMEDDEDSKMSPIGSPSEMSNFEGLSQFLSLKQKLEEDQAERLRKKAHDDVDQSLFSGDVIDVESLLENIQNDVSRSSAPSRINTHPKFTELCQQIKERDATILRLESKVHEMDRQLIDLTDTLSEREKLIGSKNEAVAVVQAKYKKELDEKDFDLKRAQQLLFDMEKRLSSAQDNWKLEKERLNKELQAQIKRTANFEEKALQLDSIQSEMETLENQVKAFEEKEAALTEKSKNQINKIKTQCQNKIKQLKESHKKDLENAVENESKVKELNNQIAELEEEKGNFLLQLVDFEEQQAQHSEMTSRLATLESDSEIASSTISELTTKISDLAAERNQLRSDLEKSEQERNQLQMDKDNQLEVQEGQRIEFEMKSVDLECSYGKTVEDLEARMSSLLSEKEEFESLKAACAAKDAQIISISEELQMKTTFIEELTVQKQQLEGQVQLSRDNIIQHNVQHYQVEPTYAPRDNDSTDLNQQIELKLKENLELQARYNELQYYADANYQQLQVLQQELNSRHEELTGLREYYEPKLSELSAVSGKLEQANQELINLKEYYETQIGQMAVSSNLEQSKQELEEKNSQIAFQQQQLNEFVEKVAGLQEELNLLKSSALDETSRLQALLQEKVQQNDILIQEREHLLQRPDNNRVAETCIDWRTQSQKADTEEVKSAAEIDWWSQGSAANEWQQVEEQINVRVEEPLLTSANQHTTEQTIKESQDFTNLQLQISMLETSNNELELSLAELKAANEILSYQNSELKDENSSLVNDLAKLRTEIINLQHIQIEIPKFGSSGTSTPSKGPFSPNQSVPVEEEAVVKKTAYQTYGDETSDDVEKAQLRVDNLELKAKFSKLVQKFKMLKEKYDSITKDNETLKQKLVSLEAYVENLEGQLQQRDSMPFPDMPPENLKIQAELIGEKEEAINELRERLVNLESYNETCNLSISNLQAKMSELTSEREQFEADLKLAEENSRQMEFDMKNQLQINEMKSSEIANNLQSIDELSTKISELMNEREELYSLKEIVETKEEQMSSLSSELQSKLKTIEDLNAQKCLLEEQLGQLQSRVISFDDLSSQKSQVEVELGELTRQIEIKTNENLEFHNRYIELQYFADSNFQQVQALQQELHSSRLELTSLKEYYEPQLSALAEKSEQSNQELIKLREYYEPQISHLSALAEKSEQSNQELIKLREYYEPQISHLSALAEKSEQSNQELIKLREYYEPQISHLSALAEKSEQSNQELIKLREYYEPQISHLSALAEKSEQSHQELLKLREYYEPQLSEMHVVSAKLEQTQQELIERNASIASQQDQISQFEENVTRLHEELIAAKSNAEEEVKRIQTVLQEKENHNNFLLRERDELLQVLESRSSNKSSDENSKSLNKIQDTNNESLNEVKSAAEIDWWSKDSAATGDWQEVEDQMGLTESTRMTSVPLFCEELPVRLNETGNQNLQELKELETSVNHLTLRMSELTYENSKLKEENYNLSGEIYKMKEEVEKCQRVMSKSEHSRSTSPSTKETSPTLSSALEEISLSAEPHDVEKQKMQVEVQELRINNKKLTARFKLLKDKYESVMKEYEILKKKNEFSLEGALEEELLSQMKHKDEQLTENSKIINELNGEKEQMVQKLDLLERANDKLLEMKESQTNFIDRILFEKKQLEQEISGLKWKLEEVTAETDSHNLYVQQLDAAGNQTNYIEQILYEKKELEDQVNGLRMKLGETVETTGTNFVAEIEDLRKQNYAASQEITSLQQDNEDLLAAVEELNKRNLLLQSQPTSSFNQSTNSQETGIEQLQKALENERNEKIILERKIELLQGKILEIEASEIKCFEESFMLKSWTRQLEMDNSKYQDELDQVLNNSSEGDGGAKAKLLQSEIMRLVDTLQERDRRCEELTMEITRLLEERDGLQLKLSNVLKHNVSLNEKVNENTGVSSDEVPTFDKENLQLKLAELEEVNFAVSLDLRREREARRIVQEQLLFSQSSRIYRDVTSRRSAFFTPIGNSSPIRPRTPAQFSPVPASIPPPVQIFTPTPPLLPEHSGVPDMNSSTPSPTIPAGHI